MFLECLAVSFGLSDDSDSIFEEVQFEGAITGPYFLSCSRQIQNWDPFFRRSKDGRFYLNSAGVECLS
jgi:hypothetical protein